MMRSDYNRKILNELIKPVNPHTNKVIVLLGARRTGKTYILTKLRNKVKNTLFLNGDDYKTTSLLQNKTIDEYKKIIGNNKIFIIDEAQNIENIGHILKIMHDNIPELKIIATGSSAFDLTNKLGEPLTGRKKTIRIFPMAQAELSEYENYFETHERLPERLLYGSYPEIFHYNSYDEKREYLYELINSYLLKDILILDNIKNSDKLLNILKLLSFQVGGEVSLNEIAGKIGISKNTVERYIDLLKKVFVIFEIKAYSNNKRKEISKMSRYYFADNGVRNAVINNFNDIDLRNDIGQLWENYIISERVKYLSYNKIYADTYFWRSYSQQEIDWIEEIDGKLDAYEIKYTKKKVKIPPQWQRYYQNYTFKLINRDNYLDFISEF
ncbi:MAG: ATP-binding protein [Bacteroidales bacterium]|nr:ATP-binding protein [Bacteroidales bacterium]